VQGSRCRGAVVHVQRCRLELQMQMQVQRCINRGGGEDVQQLQRCSGACTGAEVLMQICMGEEVEVQR
jgi:hypothetical protein